MGLFDSRKDEAEYQKIKDELLDLAHGDQGKGQITAYELVKKWLASLKKQVVRTAPSVDARRLIVGIDTLEARVNDEIKTIGLKKDELKQVAPTAMGVLTSKELFHIKTLKKSLEEIAKNAKKRDAETGKKIDSQGKKISEYIEAEVNLVGRFIDHCDDLIVKNQDASGVQRYEDGLASIDTVISSELPGLLAKQQKMFAKEKVAQKATKKQ